MDKHVPPGDTTALARAAAYLQDNGVIVNMRTRHDKYPRCCTLHSSDIFGKLVTVYTSQFRMQWPRFKSFMEEFPPTGNTTPWAYAARIYISGWFHDLYVSNREAVKEVPSSAYSQHYMHEEAYFSLQYDEFLTRLNAAIRPTHIQGMLEDTLFIPLVADNIDWDHPTSNWFGITNLTIHYECMLGLIQIMKESRIWCFSTLVTNTMGRPSWLFDWHSNNCCYAWFPAEGNYSMDDVSMAYMVGVACTPHLGPFDPDDLQPVPNGNINPSSYERITERRFFGNCEVRTLEVKTYNNFKVFNAPPFGRKYIYKEKSSGSITSGNQEPSAADTESTEIEVVQETPYVRLLDWTYYACLRAPNVECTNFL